MNNKGFTLVELIATIALIAIVLLIFTPNITNLISNFKNEDKEEMLKKSAIAAAKEYVVDGNLIIDISNCDEKMEISEEISTSDLIDNKYLENDDDNFYGDKKIKVTYDCNNKKFITYSFVDEIK